MTHEAITTLRQALEQQPADEMVGEVIEEKRLVFDDDGCVIGSHPEKIVTSGVYKLPHGTKLYTRPQPAAPAIQESDLQKWQGDNDIVMSIKAYKELVKMLAAAPQQKDTP